MTSDNQSETFADSYARALALFLSHDVVAALALCEQLLGRDPHHVEALILYGRSCEALRRYVDAVSACNRVLEIDPDNAGAYYLRGLNLKGLKRYEEALADYEVALDLWPDLRLLPGDTLHLSLQMCEWEGFEARVSALLAKVEAGADVTQPIVLAALPSTPAQQRMAAQTYWTATAPPAASPLRFEHAVQTKIRVGYFSSDFRDHPVGDLILGVLEAHDKSKFEVIGIGWDGASDSPGRHRIASACDHFYDVSAEADPDIAALARSLNLHIAVDLNGYTAGNRLSLFHWGVAPVQVGYLGYPGTSGSAAFHYIVGDSVVTPEAHASAFSEHIVTMPQCYLPGNTLKARAPVRAFTRSEAGLPEGAFVFCCFNAAHKITPDVFAVWMRLLQSVEGSVLWLLEDNAAAVRNLKREARAQGIAADRIVFAKRSPGLDYLDRYRMADLFLDTFYYNAHATAHDALMMGMPVVTRRGQAFAGRVCASLLTALGIPELIAEDAADYEALALRLARDPAYLAQVRQRIAGARDSAPLFDTVRYTRNLEQAYRTMWQTYMSGHPAGPISVTDQTR